MTDTLRNLAIAATASLPGSILIKVTLALALALAGVHFARGSRAAVRHAAVLAAFAVMLVLPFAALFAPAMTIAVPVPGAIARVADVTPIPATEPQDVAVAQGAAAPVAPPTARLSWQPSTGGILLGLWAIGASIALVRVLIGLWEIRSLRRSALPWPASRALLASIAIEGPHDRIDVLLHECVTGPMTCGVRRHAILLPRDAEAWPASDLSCALVHEIEHVRRRDWISQCVARTLCAVYWFHPLAWAAWRRLTIEAERACDDAVLRQAEPAAYADQLVSLAKRLASARPSPALAMAGRRDLATRVRAVLDDRQQRGPINGRALAVAAIACAVLVAGLGPVRVTAGAASQTNGDTRPRFDVASIKPCDPNAPGPGRSSGAGTASPGRLHIECAGFPELMRMAYQLYADGQVNALGTFPTFEPNIGLLPTTPAERSSPGAAKAPDWIRSTRFTIDAVTTRTPPPSPVVMRGPMLQTLIEDRFKLKMHHETREVAVLELVVAKGGAKVKPFVSGTCVPYDFAVSPQLPLAAGQRPCQNSTERDPAGTGYVESVEALTLDQLAAQMTPTNVVLGRPPVIDKTGITGYVSFRVVYGDAEPFVDALKDQLGLELRPAKGMRDFLVIDHVELPTADGAQVAAPTFDVASIKPCPSSPTGPGRNGGAGMTTSAGRLDVQCMPIAEMIARAYIQYGTPRPANAPASVDPNAIKDLVANGPAWIYADRYTVEATSTGNPLPTELVGSMLRNLLEGRLQLKVHQDQRGAAAYALTVASGGLKAPHADPASCTPPDPQALGRARVPEVGAPPLCANGFGWHGPNMTWKATGVTMDQVVGALSGIVFHRQVVNRTGVPGQFTFAIEFARDGTSIPALPSDVTLPDASADVPPGPSIFTALERQVGLKLDTIQGSEGFLVVDRVERPSNQ